MEKIDCREDSEGRIKMATVSAPDLEACERAYVDHLGYEVVERGIIDEDLANSWDAPHQAGSPYVIVGPASGAKVYIRFVENEQVPGYAPLRTFGWNAIEITVQDADKLHEQLKASPFEIIGEPTYLDFSDAIYPMQVIGPAGEVVYLNQVNGSLPDYDLPLARSFVDHIFIMILATPDMQAGVDFYRNALGWSQGNSYEVPYSVINNAFGFPEDRKHKLSMNCVGRIVNNEVDQYPPETTKRPRKEGLLPPGIAMVSYITQNLDKVKAPFVAPPAARDGLPYEGRRAAVCRGSTGELVELIEQP
ncbi:MAG: hypothetical protein D6763_00175 [Alphaproteobacteria bacterium]|nr:MAG: hypothetical protein D6763_00175 [Alphaproteobacteria bacterium]